MSMDAADPADGAARSADTSTEAIAEQWRDDLVSALDVVEDQPLSERAASYAALHDELARRLDSGPTGAA
ncbi:hypothetical protein PUW81_013160 [Microbacterium sp. NM3R9]|uniref:hypothetical protein n=1 Tax=Microbacterium thalli TaxID=3027921 RepID=UPI0023664C9F|nr:hypothetical protein [Microbacterium thalli]MDN8550055.1 hypothetical protein [Microbacterium thalli]